MILYDAIELQGLPQLDVKIKWPNDLYLNGLKVGGVLCTSTSRSKKFNISVGKYHYMNFFTACSKLGFSLSVSGKR